MNKRINEHPLLFCFCALLAAACSDDAGETMSDAQLAALSTTDAGSGADPDGSNRDAPQASLCQRNCALTAALDCKNTPTDCVATCETALTSDCAAHWRVLTECGLRQSPDDYFCDPTFGLPDLNPELCVAERQAVQACIQQQAE